jgi:hypothetical protein
MQLVQNELRRLVVKLVRGAQFGEEAELALRTELQSALGAAVAIDIQYVSSLDQSGAGKYRFAICNV